jgi:hypothetical protein
VECIGWFFGSTKSIDSKKIVPALKEKLQIPDHVEIGVQWRTIKNEIKCSYDWKSDDLPPQALHLDIDHNYAIRYTEQAARLWRKGAKNRVNGLQLCLIPCLGSNSAIALSDNQRTNVLLMSAKQQYFLNSYIVKVDNSHILNLDAPIEYATSKFATLRKYLMSRSPKNSVIQRIFVAIHKSWRGNDFTLVTVKPYAADPIKALNCMIRTYLYGEEAAKRWFSNTGLLAYQNVNWDPSTQATTSHQDHTTQVLVEEDLFESGSAWMTQAPILQPQANRPHSNKQPYSMENLLESRQTDNEVHSFGSVFGRQHHHGESVATGAPPPPTSTPLHGHRSN